MLSFIVRRLWQMLPTMLGVVVLVVGATVMMLVALAHQSLRKPRREAPSDDGAEA